MQLLGNAEKLLLTNSLYTLYTVTVNNMLLTLWIRLFYVQPLQRKCKLPKK